MNLCITVYTKGIPTQINIIILRRKIFLNNKLLVYNNNLYILYTFSTYYRHINNSKCVSSAILIKIYILLMAHNLCKQEVVVDMVYILFCLLKSFVILSTWFITN